MTRPLILAALAAALLASGACERRGNIRTADRQREAPDAPEVKNPYYDPYIPRGTAGAVWTPRVWDRDGTLVNPSPRAGGRPSFSRSVRPPGTF